MYVATFFNFVVNIRFADVFFLLLKSKAGVFLHGANSLIISFTSFPLPCYVLSTVQLYCTNCSALIKLRFQNIILQ